MKILLDAHTLGQRQTGNERYWKNLSLGLSKYLNPKHLFLYSNLPQKNLNKEFKNFSVFTPRLSNGLYRVLFGFNQAIKSIKPDLIHVQNFAPFKKTCPVITTVHDLCFKVYPFWFGLKTRLAFNCFFQRSLDLSDAIICDSKATKRLLIEHYCINPERVYVVYIAADPSFYFIGNKKKVKENLWQKYKIKGDYFLVVGNIENRKSPQIIINAFNNLLNKHPDIQLVFVGPNKLGIKPTRNIRILNYVSDENLNILYNGAVSLVFVSLCEGFGLPIIEAMTTKTPVICSNINVFKEIAGNSAVFVKNKEELSKAMSVFLENKNIRKKYSLLGYKRSKFFSWNKTAKQTLKIYEWVLKTKNFSTSK